MNNKFLNSKVSVVIPVYNEEKVLKSSLETLKRSLSKNFFDYEIIAVNDGSRDGSFEILKSADFVKLLSEDKNRGKGYAVKKGILSACGDYIFFTDADLSYSPEYIYRAVLLMKQSGAECIFGKRCGLKKDYPFVRRTASKIFAKLSQKFLNLDISDPQCGFKGFSKQAANRIFLLVKNEGFAFDVEAAYIAKTLNLSHKELEVRFFHQKNSRVNLLFDSVKMVSALFKIKKTPF